MGKLTQVLKMPFAKETNGKMLIDYINVIY